MADILITVDSSQVVRARQELKQTAEQALETLRASKKLTGEDRLAQHFASIDRQISKTNAAMAQANRRFAESQKGARNFEVGIQQAGYQIGDFAVQVQSGTSPLVAFSQQFSQLAGFMGPWGAALGAVAAIVAGFGVYFMKASEGVNILNDSLEELTKTTQTAKDELFALQLGFENAAQGAALRQIISLEVEAASLRQQAVQEEGLRAQYLANQALELEKQAEAARKVLEESRNSATELERARNAQKSMTLAAEEALGKYSMMRSVAAGIANEMARAAANTKAAADAALTAMSMQFSPAGGALSRYGGRGATSNRPITNQYGDAITLAGSSRPQRRPIDIDFGVPDAASGGGASSRLRKQIELTKELTQAEKDRKQVLESIEGSLESGFMAMVEGTKSVKDAFKQMAYEIIKELYRVLVVQRLVGGISGGIGMIFGKSTGSFGLPFGRASGGSIMPNQPYLVGEHGPELVIPRHSGTVVNANQTAGAMGGSGSITVQNNITVTGSDAAMVRAEVAKMIPQITNATKAAVIDARLRGGQMKSAFS